MVHHQVIVKSDSAVDVDIDPEAKILIELEIQTKSVVICCHQETLMANKCD